MSKKLHYIVLLILVLLIPETGYSQGKGKARTSKPSVDFSYLVGKFSTQPDYVADMEVNAMNHIIHQTFAKKSGKIRNEFAPFEDSVTPVSNRARMYKVIVIASPDQPIIVLDPQAKTFTELQDAPMLQAFDISKYLQTLNKFARQVIVQNAGQAQTNGYQTTKYEMRFKRDPHGINFFFASDYQDLLIKVETSNPREKFSFSLTNVSLEVPDTLFEVPKGYQEIDQAELKERFQALMAK
ncbi:MAG TPA: hypothetical protein PKZ53_13395 [Acidobacteriota bacterium]|nr:hypothetical protein [Acidobacteriota bacterium]HNG96127.1 hypothetical protein [Acidobacteriota bacterium]HNJ41482.1 hypothetical protein [Acidobacteriota bacterium]